MPAAEGHTFAGIDVSGHELSVALRNGQGDQRPALAKFPNHPFRTQGPDRLLGPSRRARTGLFGGQWKLQPGCGTDLTRAPPGGGQCNQSAAGTTFCRVARRAQQDRSGRCPCALRICGAHALGALATAQPRCPALARTDPCSCGLECDPYAAE